MTQKTGMLEQFDNSEEAKNVEKIDNLGKTDADEKINIFKKYNYEDKKFGFTRAVWMIKNYCVLPFNREKIFCSPAFYVRAFHLTKWRMILTRTYLSRKSYAVKFRLERLPCEPYIEDAIVDCCLECNDHHGEITEHEFNTTFGGNVTNYEQRLFNAGITPTNDDHSDGFEIQLDILVYFPDIRDTFPACSDIGIRRLGEDLLSIYNPKHVTDLILCFQTYDLVVHKVIFLHRLTNERFQRQITRDAELILFEDFVADQAEKVIKFLYTGNLDHAVTEPAITVFKFAEMLDIKPIVAYYDPDEIVLNSDTEVEEYYTTLTIEDFCNRDDYYLQSPVMINSMMDTKWCLQVYPKGLRGNGEYVHISLKYETKRSKDICAKFYLGKPDLGISCTYHRKISPDGILSGTDLVRRDSIINNNMGDDSLIIGLHLRMSTDKENVSVGESKSSYKHLPEQRNYDRFSQDILSIYENERFSNMRLDFSDHNIVICAHEYILDARNTNLSNVFKSHNLSYFRNINLAVIFQLFFFLYSGRIRRNISLEDAFCLYRTAQDFNYQNLMQVIVKYLHEYLSETNARRILDFAARENIGNLEYSARDILQRNLHRN